MFGLERHFIYFTSRDMHPTPSALGLRADEISVRTTDGEQIHGYYVHKASAGAEADRERITLLFSHGNAGTVAGRLDRAALFVRELPVDVALYDYRGYGRSSGAPDEPGTYADARAVYDWLLARGVASRRIVLFGESLGCAISVQLALDRSVRGVILEAPFASARAMAAHWLPLLPIGPFLRTRYDNVGKIGRISAPLLVMHGTEDEVIPFAQGEAVFRAATASKRFLAVPGAHHNDVYVIGGRPYLDALADFLRSLP